VIATLESSSWVPYAPQGVKGLDDDDDDGGGDDYYYYDTFEQTNTCATAWYQTPIPCSSRQYIAQ
jgi:hypothetical protein